ncbi:MAG: DUF4190 domain-containing protein [Nocardioides sp.]
MSPEVTPLPPSPDDPYRAKPKRENPKALWAMILGFVSLPITCLCGFGLILGVPAIILGWQSKDEPTGRWLALGGLICGVISVALGTLWLVLLATGAVHPPKA